MRWHNVFSLVLLLSPFETDRQQRVHKTDKDSPLGAVGREVCDVHAESHSGVRDQLPRKI